MTAKQSAKAETAGKAADNKSALDKYFDEVAKLNAKIAENLSESRARNDRVMDQMMESVVAGQEDMLELGRALATAPTDYRSNLQMTMDLMTRYQERALELGKTLYREQSEAGSVMTENMKEFYDAMNVTDVDWRAPYKKMAEMWGIRSS